VLPLQARQKCAYIHMGSAERVPKPGCWSIKTRTPQQSCFNQVTQIKADRSALPKKRARLDYNKLTISDT